METRQGSQEPCSLCVALAAFTPRLMWPELFVSAGMRSVCSAVLFFICFPSLHVPLRETVSQWTDVFFQDSPWTNYEATESSDWPSCLKPSLRATAEEFPQLIRSVLFIIISHGRAHSQNSISQTFQNSANQETFKTKQSWRKGSLTII